MNYQAQINTSLSKSSLREEKRFVDKYESRVYTGRTTLFGCLQRLPSGWIKVINAGLGLPELNRKVERIRQIDRLLLNPNGLLQMLDELPAQEQEILSLILQHGRICPLGVIEKAFGPVPDTSWDWQAHPKMDPFNMLRLMGLIYVGRTKNRRRVAVIPEDLTTLILSVFDLPDLKKPVEEMRNILVLPLFAKRQHQRQQTMSISDAIAFLDEAIADINAGREYSAEFKLRKICRAIAVSENLIGEAAIEMGLIQHRRGHRFSAVRWLRKGLHLSPGNARAHFSLGAVLYQLCEYHDGIAHLQQACDIDPADPHAKAELAVCIAEQIVDPIAIRMAREASETHPEYLFHYAIVLREFNRFDEALDAIDRLRREGGGDVSVDELEELIIDTYRMKNDVQSLSAPTNLNRKYRLYEMLWRKLPRKDREKKILKKEFFLLQTSYSQLMSQMDYGVIMTALDLKTICEIGCQLLEMDP